MFKDDRAQKGNEWVLLRELDVLRALVLQNEGQRTLAKWAATSFDGLFGLRSGLPLERRIPGVQRGRGLQLKLPSKSPGRALQIS